MFQRDLCQAKERIAITSEIKFAAGKGTQFCGIDIAQDIAALEVT